VRKSTRSPKEHIAYHLCTKTSLYILVPRCIWYGSSHVHSQSNPALVSFCVRNTLLYHVRRLKPHWRIVKVRFPDTARPHFLWSQPQAAVSHLTWRALVATPRQPPPPSIPRHSGWLCSSSSSTPPPPHARADPDADADADALRATTSRESPHPHAKLGSGGRGRRRI
jgi:hypothetical protein